MLVTGAFCVFAEAPSLVGSSAGELVMLVFCIFAGRVVLVVRDVRLPGITDEGKRACEKVFLSAMCEKLQNFVNFRNSTGIYLLYLRTLPVQYSTGIRMINLVKSYRTQ